MPEYVKWLKALPGKPVFVGYPAAYDFRFVYWYLIRFAGESPFSHSALDIKSYAMAVLGTGYRQTSKKTMQAAWFDKLPHTHVALDDAKEQGALFCNMLAARNAAASERTSGLQLGWAAQSHAPRVPLPSSTPDRAGPSGARTPACSP